MTEITSNPSALFRISIFSPVFNEGLNGGTSITLNTSFFVGFQLWDERIFFGCHEFLRCSKTIISKFQFMENKTSSGVLPKFTVKMICWYLLIYWHFVGSTGFRPFCLGSVFPYHIRASDCFPVKWTTNHQFLNHFIDSRKLSRDMPYIFYKQ